VKILHAITGVGINAGGTSEVVPRLCREQSIAGHSVSIVMSNVDEEYSDEMKLALAVDVKIVPAREFGSWKTYICPNAELVMRTQEMIRPYDIIHIHGLWQPSQWFIARACRQLGKPYVMMTHGFLEPERLKISKWKKRIVGYLIERNNLRHANAIVATSESEAVGLRAYGLKNAIHIMPIGLDLERFDMRQQRYREHGEKKRLLFFSRITPIKGLDMLMEAWARMKEFHNEWQLVITGPDDRGYTKQLQEHIAKLGLTYSDAEKKEKEKGRFPTLGPELPTSTIFFTGPVYGDAKYQALQSADAFVLPTRSENWSIAVAEAMATGLPVVCTKGAPWSCLEECQGGYWVDISSVAIEQGLRRVLSLYDSERHAMGRRGRAWVEKNLNWPLIASDIINFYQGIIQ